MGETFSCYQILEEKANAAKTAMDRFEAVWSTINNGWWVVFSFCLILPSIINSLFIDHFLSPLKVGLKSFT